MIGTDYWATGIMLTPHSESEWTLNMKFFDDGFCNRSSTQGNLCLRYVISTSELEASIKTLLNDANRLGIITSRSQDQLHLYIEGDGESSEVKYPEGWRVLIIGLAEKTGLTTHYHSASAGEEAV